jgi:hypothetical protein
MPNLTPVSSFDNVPELETATLALGGPGGPMNLPAQALLNRTQWLKDNATASTAGPYAAGTGTANACAAAFTPPITALADGLKLRFLAAATNTGPATFAPNALTAQPIVGGAYAALQGGEILADGEVELTWNATVGAWVITAQAGGSPQVPGATHSQHAANKGQVDQITADLASTAVGKGAAMLAWIASGIGAVARWVIDKLRERPSVVDYGADPTGVLSSVAAFNAALVANDNVFIPAGTYLLDDAVTVGLGKRLYGAGRRKTILHMPSTFNASALGCLAFTGGEPGPEVTDLTIIQDQPDSATATVYPPCIYTQNVARFVLRRLRLACVYSGIDMKGNCGGALLDDTELSPLHIGIDIDGSIDSVKISKLHLWVFAGAGFGSLTTNQRVSYTAAYGIKSGRCDDLHLSDSLLLSMVKALYLYNSASGYTFGQVTNVDFDSRGGLWVVTDGRIQLAACTMTMGATDSWFINMTGGTVAVDSTRFVANTFNPAANGLIEMSGGSLTLGPGCNLSGSGNDVQLIYATNSTLKLNGTTISRAINVAYTAPAVRVVNTQGVAVGCLCAPLGTGSSVFIKMDTDTNGFVVKDNFAKGWTVSTPAASALANTIVDGNLGAGTNRDTFSGYFSSDGTTTKVLPTGWTVSRLTAGTYTVTHNLDLAANTNMSYQLTADTTASGCSAQVDMSGTTTNVFKVRTYVGATLTDCGVFFAMRRNRS